VVSAIRREIRGRKGGFPPQILKNFLKALDDDPLVFGKFVGE
jgi:hypothetical protein